MKFYNRLLFVMAISVTCVSCDQMTKSAAQSWLEATGSWSFGILRLQLAYNQGAFLSIGSDLSESWREGILSIGNACMLLLLLGYVLFSKAVTRPLIIGIALLFAGGLSNLADRIMNSGYVVDFINLGIGSIRTGVFNIADVAITLGALFLVLDMLATRPRT